MNTYRRAIFAGIVMYASAAWADTVELPLTDDAFINAIKPNVVTGGWVDISVHNYGPKYGLVRFDAASLAGLDIGEATLTLFLNDIKRNGTMTVHPITSSWNEATVTWNNQPPVEIAPAAVVELTTSDEGSIVSVDVTATVQRWANGNLADSGFMMMTSDGIRALFDAKELAGGTQATLVVNTGESAFSGEAIVLDLSNPDNCIIDEPGYYVLDRSWYVSDSGDAVPDGMDYACGLTIRANVLLDMRGFRIAVEPEWPKLLGVINVESGDVTIRNGSVEAVLLAIKGTSDARVRLDNIRTLGSVDLQANSFVVNSEISAFDGNYNAALQVNSKSFILDTVIIGPNPCLKTYGSWVVVRNNIMKGCGVGSAVYIFASDSIFEGNYVASPYLDIYGDRNVVSWNIAYRYLTVSGTANILDANIVQNDNLVFYATGNYFGNNRVAGVISHPEGQIDWGGNVTY